MGVGTSLIYAVHQTLLPARVWLRESGYARLLENSSSTHLDFSTKQMLITACSFPTIQRLHSLKFTLVNKNHSQHSVVAVRCEGHHFLILYACAHKVLFPGQISCSLVRERHLVHKGNEPHVRLARSLPVVVGKVCEHHTGKVLNSAANL